MNNDTALYSGYVLEALAAPDMGGYASMYIMRAPEGPGRMSDVLGHFPNASDAIQFAISRGKMAVDEILSAQHQPSESEAPPAS